MLRHMRFNSYYYALSVRMFSDTVIKAESSLVVHSAPKKKENVHQQHIDWDAEMLIIRKSEVKNPLEVDQYFNGVAPETGPSFNLASYVNNSEFLQQMIKLGVSIHRWERMANVHDWVLKKDFTTDVQPIIQFFVDNKVNPDSLGSIFTKSPYILNTTIDELTTRKNYLESKKFDPVMISNIFSRNPYWLLFSTDRIDARLGFFQRVFHLTGNQIRLITCKEPRLITSNLQNIHLMNFSIKEEMGFTSTQMKDLIVAKPRLWMMNKLSLVQRFHYLHNEMKMEHETILKFPAVLTCREFRLKQRHEFLRHLKRDQFDPKLEHYVSPLNLIEHSDAHFAANVARSTVLHFNDFCKTL